MAVKWLKEEPERHEQFLEKSYSNDFDEFENGETAEEVGAFLAESVKSSELSEEKQKEESTKDLKLNVLKRVNSTLLAEGIEMERLRVEMNEIRKSLLEKARIAEEEKTKRESAVVELEELRKENKLYLNEIKTLRESLQEQTNLTGNIEKLEISVEKKQDANEIERLWNASQKENERLFSQVKQFQAEAKIHQETYEKELAQLNRNFQNTKNELKQIQQKETKEFNERVEAKVKEISVDYLEKQEKWKVEKESLLGDNNELRDRTAALNALQVKIEAEVLSSEKLMERVERAEAEAAEYRTNAIQYESALKEIQRLESVLKERNESIQTLKVENEKLQKSQKIAENLRSQEAKTKETWEKEREKVLEKSARLETELGLEKNSNAELQSLNNSLEKNLQLSQANVYSLTSEHKMEVDILRKRFEAEKKKFKQESENARNRLFQLEKENAVFSAQLSLINSSSDQFQSKAIELMRFSQQESAKITVEQHQKALEIIRDETQQRSALAHKSDVESLRKRQSEVEELLEREKKKVAELKRAFVSGVIEGDATKDDELFSIQLLQSLKTENQKLRADLSRAKEGMSGDAKVVDRLMTKVAQMEEMLRQREAKIQRLVYEQSRKDESGNSALNGNSKKEIAYLKRQVEDLIQEFYGLAFK